VACFGAGWVTTNRHIPAMRADGGYEIVLLADRNGERAVREARRLGIERAVEARSVADLPDSVGIDVVTCGTAPFAHYEVVASALEAGKHVITDKPFTMTMDEGLGLVERAARGRAQLAVVHNFQFARSVRQVDRWIDKGRLGAVRAIWGTQLSNPRRRLPSWYEELPLGLFYDESPHLLYLARHFAGGDPELDVASVIASRTRISHTPAQITAQYASPVPITLSMNFEAPLSEWHVAVLGEDAAAVVDVFRDIAVFVPNDRDHATGRVFGSSLSSTWYHWAGYLRSGPDHLRRRLRYGNDEVFRGFATAIRTGQEPARISGGDALAVLRAQHEILSCVPGEIGRVAAWPSGNGRVNSTPGSLGGPHGHEQLGGGRC
jgi:predicted dehydrogenase